MCKIGKQRTHSGAKKRIKIRKSGSLSIGKGAHNHLLKNKSKGQKRLAKGGINIHKTKMKAIRRLMPGQIELRTKN